MLSIVVTQISCDGSQWLNVEANKSPDGASGQELNIEIGREYPTVLTQDSNCGNDDNVFSLSFRR